MNTRLLRFLACPECTGDRLALDVLGQKAGDIVEGVLACESCHRRFPVIGGVPRLLPDALIGVLPRYHPEFFARYHMLLPMPARRDAVARTLQFYSFARPKLFSPALEPELLAVLIKLRERQQIGPRERAVVISTANGLKFTDFKVAYHSGTLAGVTSRLGNKPVELPNDYDAVRRAVDHASKVAAAQ